jgi:hypothetical protein
MAVIVISTRTRPGTKKEERGQRQTDQRRRGGQVGGHSRESRVYMSVANGGTALCSASVRISAVVIVAVPAARPAGALVERGTDESP